MTKSITFHISPTYSCNPTSHSCLISLHTKPKNITINQKNLKPSINHRIAARYAAKEAVAKALGTGIGKEISFQDILILKYENSSAPYVKLINNAAKVAEKLGLNKWDISISHEKTMSIAVVIGYSENN